MNSLLAVKRVPLTPPKVEQATKSDMTQAMGPKSLFENVIATASDPSTYNRVSKGTKGSLAWQGDASIQFDDSA